MGRVGLDTEQDYLRPEVPPDELHHHRQREDMDGEEGRHDLPRFDDRDGTGTCTHLRRVQEENNVRTEEPERSGHVLRQQAGENDHDPRKAQPVYLPRRLYPETIDRRELVPDTDHGDAAGGPQPALQAEREFTGPGGSHVKASSQVGPATERTLLR